MPFKRLIPVLLIKEDGLIHRSKFDENTDFYVGDPINTINIFNDYEVDELILLDIFPAREEPIKGVDSKMLLDLCSNSSKFILKKEAVINYLQENKNDVVLTLGAGDISDLVKPIINILS